MSELVHPAEFSKIEVCEIMRPRVDVVALSINDSFEEVLRVIHEREYSRMPVYENDLDHIVGV
ncbi:MAG: CBS domain-containing protein, partial [Bacteroidales bacterium]|nr:CBS domain-containing protein [Bacteroidales bacterium]